MKVVGKKAEYLSRSISSMIGIYFFVLALILVIFLNNYANPIFIVLCISMATLIIERVIKYISFKRLPSDLITMHRDHITIKSNHNPREIKYKYIQEIIANEKKGKLTFIMSGNDKVEVKYCDNYNYVRKEILDYKEKYYNN